MRLNEKYGGLKNNTKKIGKRYTTMYPRLEAGKDLQELVSPIRV
jgi:hypothetical protein